MNSDTHNTSPTLAVCVATYQRPDQLRRLLDSFTQLCGIQFLKLELRVVDNDRAGSAANTVAQFEARAHPFSRVSYVVEARQNIAHARNRAIQMGPADVLVFVDDDEWVERDWLHQLWTACLEYEADAVFGPVHGRCPEGVGRWLVRGGFFDKPVPPTGTELDWRQTRTSNTLVRGKWFYGEERVRFDPALGRSGGSDSELFSRLADSGAKFVSCREASVAETVPPTRARLGWLLGRWYRNGLIFEHIQRHRNSGQHPVVRAVRRLGAALLLSSQGILPAFRGRPEQLVQAGLKLALAGGGIKAWMRPQSVTDHVAYAGTGKGRSPNSGHSRQRVAFLTNIVSPYRLPVFRLLAATPGWDFRVLADAQTEFDRSWRLGTMPFVVERPFGLRWKRTVRSTEPVPFSQKITLHLPVGVLWNLLRFRPHTVISLELGVRTAIAALYCTLFSRPLVIWAYQSRVSASQGRWRNRWRRFLLRRAERVVGMGTQARKVLREWGVPSERIIDAPNAPDHPRLEWQISRPGSAQAIEKLRSKHAFGKKLAIVAGRLIPLKGIEPLLQAWSALPAQLREEWQLVFVGDGPLESIVRNQMQDPSIDCAGFVPVEEMAIWYAAADLHIFATLGDVWGLVVNEAAVCGAPTLCSIQAGCFEELIEDGVTGFGWNPIGASAASQLEAALAHPNLPAVGENAKRLARRFSLDNMAAGFRKAVSLTGAGAEKLTERKTVKLTADPSV